MRDWWAEEQITDPIVTGGKDLSNHASDTITYVDIEGDTHTVKHGCCGMEEAPEAHTYVDGKCDCGAEEHFCEPYDYRYADGQYHDLVCQCGKALEEDLEHELTENGYCLCGGFPVELDFNGGRYAEDETVTGTVTYCLGSFRLPVEEEYLEELDRSILREGFRVAGIAYDAAGTRIYSGEEHTGSVTLYLIWEEEQSIPEPDSGFVDVVPGAYYEIPVEWAVEKGITTGVDDSHFAPGAACTRAQVVTFLWRAAGSPEPASASNPFADVSEGSYYYKAVLWAAEKGITAGTSATAFSPNAPCTRGQVVTFLWRFQGKPASGGSNVFGDVAPGTYCYDAVLWAVEKGITQGMGDGTFGTASPCSRAQIVTFLYRTLG